MVWLCFGKEKIVKESVGVADGCGCSGCQERRVTTMVVTVYNIVADGVRSYLVLVGWHAKARGEDRCGVSLVRKRWCWCWFVAVMVAITVADGCDGYPLMLLTVSGWFVAVMVAVAVADGCDGYPLMLLTVLVLFCGSDGGHRCGLWLLFCQGEKYPL